MRPGKETVQLYVSAPQGALGKPALELKAFQKTRLLQPGETACVSLTVPEEQLASYDDSGVTGAKSAYVLEPGDYFFYVGNSIRERKAVQIDGKAAWSVSSLIVTEQLEEALAPVKAFRRMKPGAADENGVRSWNMNLRRFRQRIWKNGFPAECRRNFRRPDTGESHCGMWRTGKLPWRILSLSLQMTTCRQSSGARG